MIIAKIDVSKIDKNYLFQGKKGTYLDVCLIETPDSKYGNAYMCAQGIPKEERDAGKSGPILGNADVVGKGSLAKDSGGNQVSEPEEDTDPLPF